MITENAAQTLDWGRKWAQSLQTGDVIALYGDLGAGKTTLVKGIVEALTSVQSNEVVSPTFSYLNIYEGKVPLYHFDLYRLEGAQEFLDKGFLDFFEGEGICLIEWPDRIQNLLPKNTLHITLSYLEEETRRIHVTKS